MANDLWRSDWGEFVRTVARMHNEAKSDVEISSLLGGEFVEWHGKIQDLELNDQDTPGVEFKMEETIVLLAGKQHIKASYLYVNVNEDEKTQWLKYSKGDDIFFRAKIIKSTGPVPGVRVSLSNGSDEAVLLIIIGSGMPR